jgi:hypothetical protein
MSYDYADRHRRPAPIEATLTMRYDDGSTRLSRIEIGGDVTRHEINESHERKNLVTVVTTDHSLHWRTVERDTSEHDRIMRAVTAASKRRKPPTEYVLDRLTARGVL